MHGGAVTSYVIFNNIIIDCAVTECGIYLTAPVHHIRFSNMEVMNSTTSSNGAGMISGNASFLEFLNCKIHDAGAGNCSKYANQGCYGFYLNGHDNLIDGCQIYNNGGYGVHMYQSGGTGVSNNIVRNSIFYGNGFNDTRGL